MSTTRETVLILDFGSQYTQLIARRVREQRVYSEIHPYTLALDKIRAMAPRAIILSGGPSSCYEPGAPTVSPELFALGVPVLGICYGLQLTMKLLGGVVVPAQDREYGRATVRVTRASGLLDGFKVGEDLGVWMSHGDRVEALAPGFEVVADTPSSPFTAVVDRARSIHGVQFHPEVAHTPRGNEIISNFLFKIAGCKPDWTMVSFVDEAVAAIRAKVGDSGKVLCALSGGVDSSVVAALVHKAIGDRLTCVFVDNGLLRGGEREQVDQIFKQHFKVDLRVVDAEARFLASSAASPSRRPSASASGASSSRCSTRPRTAWAAASTSWPRARCTPTSSRACRTRGPRPPSRRTTTSAACPRPGSSA